MHTILYSKEQLQALYTMLEDNNNNLLNAVIPIDNELLKNEVYWFKLSSTDTYEIFYTCIKRAIDQFPFEVMFHYPLTNTLLLMNHPNILVKTIVSWRIQISK